MGTLQEVMSRNTPAIWAMAAICIVCGILACFMGYRLLKLWVGIIGCGTGFLAGFLVGRIFLESIWLCIGIGVVLAVTLAVLAFRFHLAGIFLLCAAAMFLVTKVLFHGEEWWIYLICGIAAAAAGVLGICFVKPMLITVTGLCGGFLAAGGILSVVEIDEMIVRLAFTAVLAAAGIWFQFYNIRTGKTAQEEVTKREERREKRRQDGDNVQDYFNSQEGRKEARRQRRQGGQKNEALVQKQRHERRRQNRQN